MCIEVEAGDGTRILLDLGMPLYDEAGRDYELETPRRATQELIDLGVLRPVPGLYCDDPSAPGIEAIFLTHSHLDHYGLAHHARPEIPVYGSVGTIAVLNVGRVFFPDTKLPASLMVMPENQPVIVGSMSVTAIPVDHAAPDSRALLVEADDQALLFTGDLRAHGRTARRFDKMLNDSRLQSLDYLLMEGTTLGAGGDGHGLRSEQDVEESLVELAQGQPDALVAVIASGQNLDRLISCYRAARRTGRFLVVDPYQAFVLMRLAPLSPAIPQFTWEGVKVSFAPHQVERLKVAGEMDLVYKMGREAKVGSDELAAAPGRYLMCARGSLGTTKLFGRIGARVVVVWSMWGGYWKRDRCAVREWAERTDSHVHFIHSGGHAWPEDLRRLAEGLDARHVQIVHTALASPDAYSEE